MNKNLKPVITVAGVTLALSLAFTGLVGCGNENGKEDESSTPPSIYESDESTDAGTGSTADSESSSDGESSVVIDPSEYETRNETVYVTADSITLRSEPRVSESTVVGYAMKGKSFLRVKYNEYWSVLVYGDQEVYATSEYLALSTSSDSDVQFNPVDKTIYVVEEKCNLRMNPSSEESSTIIANAVLDDALQAIGLSKDGEWYKILHNEQTLYVHSSCVSDKRVDADFTELNKTVYVLATQLSVRVLPSAEDNSRIAGYVGKGDAVTVIAVNSDNSWYKIKHTFSDGTSGEYYIKAEWTSDTAPAESN